MMEYGLVARWLLTYLALFAAGIPLAGVLFPRLADRGAGVAVTLSAAVLWVVAYWVGHLSLTLGLRVGLGVLLALAALATYRRRPDVDGVVVAETAVVFTVAFLFVVGLRAVDPAVNPMGGEKFLDFGLLRSLLRAEALPPEDMWFAGESVSYYYGGQMLASLLTRLTGTAPQYAYNLALAGWYGMLVTAAYGLGGSIAAHRGSPRRAGATLAAFFVGVASNLSTPAKLVAWLLPESTLARLAESLAFDVTGLAKGPAQFYYWNASRIIEGAINEFPLFSWLNGDLHAHMLSTPFTLLAATVCLAYYLTPESERARRGLLVLGLLPPLAGLLAVVNTWSFPTVGGLALLTLLFAPGDPRTLVPDVASFGGRNAAGVEAEVRRLLTAAVLAVAVLAVGFCWSLPFWFGTASTQSVGLFPDRSRLGALVLVHGGFLVVFVPYLLRHSLSRFRHRRALGGGIAVLALVGVAVGAPAVTLFAPILLVAWVLLRLSDWPALATGPPDGTATRTDGTGDDGRSDSHPQSPTRPGFETLLVVAGAGLVLLVEFAYVEELAGPGRLNTVFKTYMQVWILWGVAAGVVSADLVWNHRPGLRLAGGRWKPAFRWLAVVLVVTLSLYGAFALSGHFTSDEAFARTGDPTLDATAFVRESHSEEAPAIEWLDEREGTPTLVSAPGSYWWNPEQGQGASAAASLTGVPTVVGWNHEVGYRGEQAYQRRVTHVETIYTGDPDDQARLLAEYDVRYIYVSPAERATYGEITVADLSAVSVAKSWDEVTIYEVDRDELQTGGR